MVKNQKLRNGCIERFSQKSSILDLIACLKYVAIDNSDEQDRIKLQTGLATHHDKAAKGYESLQSDSKDTTNSVVLSFDLQQNLPVPTLTHGSMFYLRHLWVYNFGDEL